jgi:hypothetical protein
MVSIGYLALLALMLVRFLRDQVPAAGRPSTARR